MEKNNNKKEKLEEESIYNTDEYRLFFRYKEKAVPEEKLEGKQLFLKIYGIVL